MKRRQRPLFLQHEEQRLIDEIAGLEQAGAPGAEVGRLDVPKQIPDWA